MLIIANIARSGDPEPYIFSEPERHKMQPERKILHDNQKSFY
jgi:hypothetical protein